MKRVIFHVDVNSAFLSWEAVYRIWHLGGKLDLREIPSAVAGDMAMRHGIILAKSIPAKKYKIHTGEPVTDAMRKCPKLVMVPPNYGLYQRTSAAFIRLLGDYTPAVEQYSIDEAFMDMTGMEGLLGEPEAAAEMIRERICRELGFTVNIGVSSNKLLAKMASDFKKPDRVHTLWPEELETKMWPLPVADLFFAGPASDRKLRNLGIRTIGELAQSDAAIIRRHMGKHGEILWAFANGMDTAEVEPSPPPNKGYGNSTTTPFNVTDQGTAKLVLLSLAETLAARLRADKVHIGVVAVGIRDCDFRYYGHQITLGTATSITEEVYEAACRVFEEMWDGTPIRHLGIHTSRVVSESFRQRGMFERMDYEKLEIMGRSVDDIRRRFGHDVLQRAAFCGSLIDHMSGGVSREKRTVDYNRQNVL